MDMQKLTQIALAWELHQTGIKQLDIARDLKVHRDTLRRWFKAINELGLLEYLDWYAKAKKGERKKKKIDGVLKKLVWRIREEENNCCGQKIRYFLDKEHGVSLGTTTIYKILAEKYQLRTKWKKNKVRGHVPKAQSPREVVQMDTVDFGEIFAFTAVDIFTKEVDVLLRPSLTALDGKIFLEKSMSRRFNNFTQTIQTDGGPEFKAEFHQTSFKYCNCHRYARPYKKNEQSYIESFNRSLRKECLGWSKYKSHQLLRLTKEVESYLNDYHYRRPHLSLNMKPPLPIT